MPIELKDRMNGHTALAMDDALEGARRATGDASSIAPPDPEVAATARRRQFSMAERRRILIAADGCKASGEIGALLRREGIYSSHLSTWRKQRAAVERAALEPQKRGRKADPALAETAKRNLQAAGVANVGVHLGDGSHGLPAQAPYDAIAVSGSMPALPPELLQQLKIGGRLVAFVGEAPVMHAQLVTRTDEDAFNTINLFETVVAPLGNAQQRGQFVF